MRNRVITVIREQKLWLVFLAAALVKQLLVIGVPICPVPGSPCDDELLRDWAFSIAGFDWLGDFNAYTFMKEPGFAIFLAFCYRLHLPYIYAVTACYSIACMVFSDALRNIFSSKKYVAVVYLVLLFHPISFSSTVLQKVYRNGLGVILTLCVFGGLLHLYFAISQEKLRLPLFWSAFTGLSLGYLWITKSDTAWLLPFTVVVCLVILGILLVKYRNFKSLPRYICLVLPFLGMALCTKGVEFLNIQRYGISSLEYYGAAMSQFTQLKPEQENEKLLLTRKQLKELYRISPTLASVEEDLEKEMDAHNTYDTNPEDGEVETGWLGWALVRGFHDAGVYENSERANLFFKNLYEELEAGFADGRLKRAETQTAQKYHIDTPAHRRELMGRAVEAINYIVSGRRTCARVYYSDSGAAEGSVRSFEKITRNKYVCHNNRYDYVVGGWIVFPQYEGKKLSLYVEDEDGRQYRKLNFRKSEDVYQHLKAEGSDLESAKRCHFRASWDVDDGQELHSWYLGVYEAANGQDGQKLTKVKMTEKGFKGEANTSFFSSLDSYYSRQKERNIESTAKAAVARLNCIRFLYRRTGVTVFQLSIIAYIVLTFMLVRGLRRKEFAYVNPWLITTGLGLSVLVLAIGIAYVDLTQCPAIKTLYLSSGYPLLMATELISLCKCAELVMVWAEKRRRQTQYRIEKQVIG